MNDRDALKREKPLELISEGEVRSRKLIFRNMFIREEDARIAKVIWNYFQAVSERWPEAWNQKQKGLILNRTTGYRALMQFLPLLILSLDWIDKVPDPAMFRAVFDRVSLKDKDMNTDEFKPGTSGQSKLRNLFEVQTRITSETVFRAGRYSLDKMNY